jgi:hypothetical protein
MISRVAAAFLDSGDPPVKAIGHQRTNATSHERPRRPIHAQRIGTPRDVLEESMNPGAKMSGRVQRQACPTDTPMSGVRTRRTALRLRATEQADAVARSATR